MISVKIKATLPKSKSVILKIGFSTKIKYIISMEFISIYIEHIFG